MAELKQEQGGAGTTSFDLGMHSEQLAGRTQQRFFTVGEGENFLYPDAPDVDFNKRTEFDAAKLDARTINRKIRALANEGYGTIVVHNPGARHSLGVGILHRLQLYFEGSLGYFGCGLIDGPNIRISGRVGWSCAENMMAGTVVIEKNAGSTFGAALRGGRIIAEVKRASPSRGIIVEHCDSAAQARAYVAGGAAAVTVTIVSFVAVLMAMA